ncbi:MAG: IPT/TIG domain-containing protein [Deltaproteobacteria bacterium]|nr:IPT/TIG domain-containing protein [Deltaproteobacteria bacterium]
MLRRTPALLGLIALSVSACRDEGLDSDAGPVDSGPALPDARVVPRIDAGPLDADDLPEPTLNTVLPRSGSELGGTRVVLRGTAFIEPLSVRFGSAEASSVVRLDEVSIAATSPPGPVGRVTVYVDTPGGEAELPNGFSYVRDLQLTGVSPSDIPEEGGVALSFAGIGFDEHTLILMDRQPIRGQKLVSAELIEGFAPALSPGRPEILALNVGASARRSDLVRVFATPQTRVVAPEVGPTSGGTPLALEGDGFQALERVQIGGSEATQLTERSGELVEVLSPALPEGAHDVKVSNAFAEHDFVGGFVAVSSTGPSPAIVAVTPPRIPATGASLTVAGRGLELAERGRVGGVLATIVRTGANAAELVAPGGLPVGMASVDVFVGSSTLSVSIEVFQPVELLAVTPTSAPSLGGTTVRVSGRGFAPGTEIRIADVPLADLALVSDTEATGRIRGGSYGPQDLKASGPNGSTVLRGAFFFREPFEIVGISPDEGSIAGNTLVTVYGRGLSSPAQVSFAGTPAASVSLENGSVLSARPMPAPPGSVTVDISSGSSTHVAENAYAFYDPRIITGGGWGGPIEGSVNVGVLDPNSGMPIPGMVVQLGLDANLRYTGVTDENGVATISWPEVFGPQTVTVGQNEFGHATFVEVNTRNLTFYVSPYPAPPPPDAPNQPCPEGGEPPVVKGKVFKFKSALDPRASPGWIPIAQITYSQPSVFSPNPPLPPEQIDYVFSDGEEYEIIVTRGGPVSVYALMGDYNQETMEFIPRKLGIRRQVPAAPGSTVEGADIELDLDLDRHLDVRLDQPPTILPGPTANAIFPFVNLASEGVIPLPPSRISGSATVPFDNLPNAAGLDMLYMGGSYTDAGGQLTYPYSITLASSDDESLTTLDIGPFLEMPRDLLPKQGRVLEDGALSWTIPGTQPDVTTVYVVDGTSISGCCCADVNMNGTCEDDEPLNCGAAPVQYERWSIYGPGLLMSYPMPAMPPGISAFETGTPYFYLVQQGIAPRFDWHEFIYNQFSPYFWRSWSVWFSQFLAKEETRPAP